MSNSICWYHFDKHPHSVSKGGCHSPLCASKCLSEYLGYPGSGALGIHIDWCVNVWVIILPLDKDCCTTRNCIEYQGSTDRSESGLFCFPWTSVAENVPVNVLQFPDRTLNDASNFCRNVGGLRSKPWCYTDKLGTSWQYCNISFCGQYFF